MEGNQRAGIFEWNFNQGMGKAVVKFSIVMMVIGTIMIFTGDVI